MKISIITVCYNSESTIQDTILSILSQDYDDIEYIIIDGGSKDKTLEIIEKYSSSISKLVSEPDKGIYDAMNKGVALSTGDVVGVLNSDDYLSHDSVVTNIVNAFVSDVSIDAVYGDIVFVESGLSKKVKRFYSLPNFKPWQFRFGWMPPHTGTFIKKSVYQALGDYQLNYKIASDYELFVRFFYKNKLKLTYIDEVVTVMRLGGVSTSGVKNSILLNREIVNACKGNGIYTNIFFVSLKIPFKALEFVKRPKKSLLK